MGKLDKRNNMEDDIYGWPATIHKNKTGLVCWNKALHQIKNTVKFLFCKNYIQEIKLNAFRFFVWFFNTFNSNWKLLFITSNPYLTVRCLILDYHCVQMVCGIEACNMKQNWIDYKIRTNSPVWYLYFLVGNYSNDSLKPNIPFLFV